MTAEHHYDAHPSYRELRELGPAPLMELPGGLRARAVTRYRQVLEFLRAPEFTRDPRQVPQIACAYGRQRYPEDLFSVIGRHLLNTDGADHARLRRLVLPYFTRRRVESWRPMVTSVVDQTLDRIAGQERVDLVADFAIPIPLIVIGHILGIPADLQPEFAARLTLVSHSVHPDDPDVRQAVKELLKLAADLLRAKWDSRADDVISTLIRACREQGTVSRFEIMSLIVFLLAAGYETTTSLLASGALVLLTRPDLAAGVRSGACDAGELVNAVLRHEPPVPFGLARFALTDTTLDGVPIGRGEIVYPLLAAANRDPEVFTEPDSVHLEPGQPAHLSFGIGARRCLGAELALLEAKIALPRLIRRFPQLRLAQPGMQLPRRGVLHVRGLERLPVLVYGVPATRMAA